MTRFSTQNQWLYVIGPLQAKVLINHFEFFNIWFSGNRISKYDLH